MAHSEDVEERREVAWQLRQHFAGLPDKKQATKDMLILAKDKDNWVRIGIIDAIGHVFPHVMDKEEAWKDLLSFTTDEEQNIRWRATFALGFAFPHVIDKKQATKDFLMLTKHEEIFVRRVVASSLGSAFPHVTDKEQALKALLALTKDEDEWVRIATVSSLGSAFPHVTDKEQAWKALLVLTKDEGEWVRLYAYHSLGKISILKATEGYENEFKKELEKALEYFEKSSENASSYNNPAKFCLPFYRSFHAITFKKDESEAEVKKSIEEAKEAVEGSESKGKLIDAIENLSNALIEAQKAKGFDEIKGNLNAYIHYCNLAADLLVETEGDAPSATMLVRKGLPIIDKKIKDTLFEIEENAKEFCKESQQTKFKNISRSAYDNVRGLGEINNPISVEIRLDRLIPIIRDMCDILPEESRGFVCGQLDGIKDVGLRERTIIVESAFNCIRTQQKSLQEELGKKEKDNDFLKDDVLSKLDNISFGISKLKLRSGEIVPSLRRIEKELDTLKTIETKLNSLESSSTEFKHLTENDIQRLNDEITRLTLEIETKVIPKLPQTSDNLAILDELNKLKQSDKEIWFNRVSGMSSLIGLLISIFSAG